MLTAMTTGFHMTANLYKLIAVLGQKFTIKMILSIRTNLEFMLINNVPVKTLSRVGQCKRM
jgi:hypothetical protein